MLCIPLFIIYAASQISDLVGHTFEENDFNILEAIYTYQLYHPGPLTNFLPQH